MNHFPLLHPLERISRWIHGEGLGNYLTAGIALDILAMILSESPLLYNTMFVLAFSSMIALGLNHIGAAYHYSDEGFQIDRTNEKHLTRVSTLYGMNWVGLLVVIVASSSLLANTVSVGLLIWGLAVIHISLCFRLTCLLDKFTEEEA